MAQGSNIAYLFGAGATHAELMNLYPDRVTEDIFIKRHGLLLPDVSRRVCKQAKARGWFSPEIQRLLSSAGLSNIELFIGLIEKNKTKSEATIEKLKDLMGKDIKRELTDARLQQFCLHRALLEMHKRNKDENLLGVISLNYDSVLDQAFVDVEFVPNYGMHSTDADGLLLLKLHGGFKLEYNGQPLPIMTPGINKNYLELPYNFVWGRALEILYQCDILRVIGCSLSQNDIGLLDLLFKAHLARGSSFEIQMIAFDPRDNDIKERYGFLPNIKTAVELEGGLKGGMISEPEIRDALSGANPFKLWLKAKILKLMSERSLSYRVVSNSKYMNKVVSD